MAKRFSVATRSRRAVIPGVAFAAYLLGVAVLSKHQVTTAAVLFVLPVISLAWCYGIWAGFLVALSFVPTHTLVLRLLGRPRWAVLLRPEIAVVATGTLALIGAVVGKLRDTTKRLETDITERKRAEERSRDLARFPHENPRPVLRVLLDGDVLYVNRAGRILTESWGEHVGRAVPQEWLQALQGALRTESPATLESEIGDQTFSFTFAPVAQRDYVNVYGLDITKQKEAEERTRRYTKDLEAEVEERAKRIHTLERQHMEAEKIIALGQLAAGVAHEINNPLGTIQNCFHLVKSMLLPEHRNGAFVRFIDDSIERVAAIVRDMYRLYQPRYAEPSAIDINEILGDVLVAMKGAMSALGVVLGDQRSPDLPETFLPAGEVAQILSNVVRNALEAMPDGGRLTVETGREDELPVVKIRDTGPGIAPDMLPHIFEPFFTTKGPSNRDRGGMGLGLSVCQSLAQGMGGHIEVESEVGSGTCFTISFPVAQPESGESS